MDVAPTPHHIIQRRARTLGVLAAILAIFRWRRRKRNRLSPRKYGPLVDRDLVRQKRLDDLYKETDINCITEFQMRKAVFWKLSSQLHDDGLPHDSDNEFDKQGIPNDMSGCAETKDPEGEDSNKPDLDSDDCKEVAALSATACQVSSSNVGDLKPKKKNFKRSEKPKTLPPSHGYRTNNDMDVVINSTLLGIKESLSNPIHTAAPQDPNAPLWNMLKNVALTPEDRMTVGLHLCKPEFQIHRGFLASMGREYLERWAYKHLSGDDPSDM